jgi:murein DD-endopeptidase MepM/ murein hydrolase activator NlpD
MAESPQTVRIAEPTGSFTPDNAVKTAEPAGSLPGFRWPVRGRVIAAFGPKPNGVQNDGINLAVPEGTPIKAAEDGVVAYAGSELKGYGNLVLVRHPNGFVTAYAHASDILVKRGEAVKRGQVIAHAGQTGNVTSPQLHFEIRKGATPVDPSQYLSGA